MARSLPDISQKVVANASQFVNEFQRADNATRRAAANIDREMDKLAKTVKRKFSVSDVGKDLLRGFGLGSGFAVLTMAIDKWSAVFKEADENAKDFSNHLKEIQQSAREISSIRFDNFLANLSPEGQVKQLESAADQLDAKIEAARKKDLELKKDLSIAGEASRLTIGGTAFDPLKGKYGYGTMKGIGDKIDAAIQENDRELTRLEKERVALDKRIDSTAKKVAEAASKADEEGKDRRAKILADLKKEEERVSDALIAAREKREDATEKEAKELGDLVEKYRLIADPAREFKIQLQEIDRIMAQLTPEEYARAVDAVGRSMKDAELGRVDKALDSFFGDMDARAKLTEQTSEAARDLGFSFQSAFEDAILSGEKFSDVLDGLLQDIARIALRTAITEPLGQWIGGLFGGKGTGGSVGGIVGGIGKLFGFANGGDFTVGGSGATDSQVVAFRATPGERVSIRTPAQAAGGGSGGGVTVHQTNNFSSGVTRQELASMLPKVAEAGANLALNKISRGGSARRMVG